MPVERDQLWPQLPDPFYKCADQFCLSALADVRRAERVNAPPPSAWRLAISTPIQTILCSGCFGKPGASSKVSCDLGFCQQAENRLRGLAGLGDEHVIAPLSCDHGVLRLGESALLANHDEGLLEQRLHLRIS